jgi:DNA-binding transcriptional MerR regulator
MAERKYTTPEAAKLIGVSRQTLQAWIKGRLIETPELSEVANLRVRLWNKADIQRAKRFKGTLRRGPEPKKRKPRMTVV